jgi:hypothetical protein
MVLGQFVDNSLIDMHGTSDTVEQMCVFSKATCFRPYKISQLHCIYYNFSLCCFLGYLHCGYSYVTDSFRRVRETAKSDYRLRQSVSPHGTNRLPLNGF